MGTNSESSNTGTTRAYEPPRFESLGSLVQVTAGMGGTVTVTERTNNSVV